jgi:hypothetical protein
VAESHAAVSFEKTDHPAKISGIKRCESYKHQYGWRYALGYAD